MSELKVRLGRAVFNSKTGRQISKTFFNRSKTWLKLTCFVRRSQISGLGGVEIRDFQITD